MASTIRKFVIPTVLSHLILMLLLVPAVFALVPGVYAAVDAATGYTPAYTYDSLFTDDGVLIRISGD